MIANFANINSGTLTLYMLQVSKNFSLWCIIQYDKIMVCFFFFQWMVVLHPTPTSLLVARPVEVECSLACDRAPTLNHGMVGRTVLETTKRHASAIHSLVQVSLFYEAHNELDLMIQKSGSNEVKISWLLINGRGGVSGKIHQHHMDWPTT